MAVLVSVGGRGVNVPVGGAGVNVSVGGAGVNDGVSDGMGVAVLASVAVEVSVFVAG